MTRERTLQGMRDDLTHAMVHDLRNPLNIVSGVLAMLRELPGLTAGSEEEQMLDIARHSTARMLELVNGILGISQLESGRMPLDPVTFDLDEMVTDVLDAQRPLAKEKQLTLETDGNGSGVGIEADQNVLQRVLENLVGNAIKFTPQGGIVSVTVEPLATSVEIAVSDTGPGVPVEIRDQLFNKFVRGGQAERGSGLGLAFCRMAVEAHGGSIWLDTDRESGATFRVTLPRHGKNGSRPPRPLAELAQPST
jgi:signal transduction histidine kinase